MGRWFELNDEDTRNGGGFHADLVLRRRKHLWVRWGVIEVVILAPILITVLSHIITFLRRNPPNSLKPRPFRALQWW
ncbi:hypothetical protein BC936DRAFT_136811 [Jimgerdemannia flammicorona]|uniref:Uncharacterized protein n=1 Tax=Jimgerdemannia flammicorona TaxID=994334 RepID=A0A433CYS8_9FUNG|nr:hypothetical protein BC936DRAFT_136811 [Jimgerdemannia flammicorona]